LSVSMWLDRSLQRWVLSRIAKEWLIYFFRKIVPGLRYTRLIGHSMLQMPEENVSKAIFCFLFSIFCFLFYIFYSCYYSLICKFNICKDKKEVLQSSKTFSSNHSFNAFWSILLSVR
jgi:hypothetical protein